MYEIMDDLEDPKLEAIKWIGNLKWMCFLFFLAYFPNITGQPLSVWDAGGIGFFITYLYYVYLKYKELKDA